MLMARDNTRDVQQALSGDYAVGEIVDFDGASELNAEIVPTKDGPKWHVLETLPAHERIVAAHLVGRRFGAYLPEMQYEAVVTKHGELRRGTKFKAVRMMMPGYVFVFVWDIGLHWDRLKGIPGVSRIMCNALGREIVILDQLIDRIRAAENVLNPGELADVLRKAKRRWRKSRMEDTVDVSNEVVQSRCWDPLKDIIRVDDKGKNQTLGDVLGLAS